MRSYGQYCAMARSLDVVGDRWSLLVVRELLDGPRRYGQLRAGLPGIATNLLGQRLRSLVDAGVVAQADGRYALTPWGEGLREVLYALGRWGMPLMAREPADDALPAAWLRHLVAMHLGDVDEDRRDGVIELRVGDQTLTMIVVGGKVLVADGRVDATPDVVVTGPPDGVGGLVTGFLTPDQAAQRGVHVAGEGSILTALPPARMRLGSTEVG